jgi:hypothetical protein
MQGLILYKYNTIVRNVMAYNIYHIYITNIKDNDVIEPDSQIYILVKLARTPKMCTHNN